MMESAVLYSCWSRLPKISGTANNSRFLKMLPSVISRVFLRGAVVVCGMMFSLP